MCPEQPTLTAPHTQPPRPLPTSMHHVPPRGRNRPPILIPTQPASPDGWTDRWTDRWRLFDSKQPTRLETHTLLQQVPTPWEVRRHRPVPGLGPQAFLPSMPHLTPSLPPHLPRLRRFLGARGAAPTGPSMLPAALPSPRASSTPTHPNSVSKSPDSAPGEGPAGHPPTLAAIASRPVPPRPLQTTSQPPCPHHVPCPGSRGPPKPWAPGSHLGIPSAKQLPGSPCARNTGGPLQPQGLCGCCSLPPGALLPKPRRSPSPLPQPPSSARPSFPVRPPLGFPPVLPGPPHGS